jgi:hypothetical protein
MLTKTPTTLSNLPVFNPQLILFCLTSEGLQQLIIMFLTVQAGRKR